MVSVRNDRQGKTSCLKIDGKEESSVKLLWIQLHAGERG